VSQASAEIPRAVVRPHSARAWVLAARLQTLPAALVPVAVGTAIAHAVGGFRAGPALAALLGAALIQIGTNFANDVFDHEKGADDEHRLGPTRAVASGLLGAREMRIGMGVAFALAIATGVYLTAVAGPWVVAIGVASVASGIAYTGGPFPLGYHGLGDLFVMAFFGFVAVCGTAFVQVGAVPEIALLASVPVGSLATAILVVNNLRDRGTDARAGKRTLAVRHGVGGAVAEYHLLVLLSYAVPPALVAFGLAGAWVLLPLGTAPFGAILCHRVARRRGRDLNPILAQTAALLLSFGMSFAAGIMLGA